MPTANPIIASQLQTAREELARLKSEKARLYPPNPHPFSEPDRYPGDSSPEQIAHRNELIARIELLERQIEDLQDRLFTK